MYMGFSGVGGFFCLFSVHHEKCLETSLKEPELSKRMSSTSETS